MRTTKTTTGLPPNEKNGAATATVAPQQQQQQSNRNRNRSKIQTTVFHYPPPPSCSQKLQQNQPEPQPDTVQAGPPPAVSWSFRTRTSHILDSAHGHYAWKRELQCFQGQALPDAIYHENALEITCTMGGPRTIRLRFGALEGLRGWRSHDTTTSLELESTNSTAASASTSILSSHARTSPHWQQVQQQVTASSLPSASSTTTVPSSGNTKNVPTVPANLKSTRYDYTYTTPYKGGTDGVVNTTSSNDKEIDIDMYDYLRPNSSSFIATQQYLETNPVNSRGGNATAKLRKPICTCKSDGGRKPFLASPPTPLTTTKRPLVPAEPQQDPPPPPHPLPAWTIESSYKVDIEGMLRRANGKMLYRSPDVFLWEDDLHDTGTTCLKVRCFVCDEGWACLLRQYVRLDDVLVRVMDTRYLHTFAGLQNQRIYREHSIREGTWHDLLAKIGAATASPSTSRPATTRPTTTTTRQPTPRQHQHRPSPISLEAMNDSIAALYLPVTQPPVTEYLSLAPSPRLQSSTDDADADGDDGDTSGISRIGPKSQLLMMNDVSIDEAIPVRGTLTTDEKAGPRTISFLLKKSKGTLLEAINYRSSGNATTDNAAIPHTSATTIWSKSYRGYYIDDDDDDDDESDRGHDHRTLCPATILSVRVSPQFSASDDDDDRRMIAIGNDRGYVELWQLSTGDYLYKFPVAPLHTIQRYDTKTTTAAHNSFTTKLWVESLVWTPPPPPAAGTGAAAAATSPTNGNFRCLLGAAAGRSTVVLDTTGLTNLRTTHHDQQPKIVSTFESKSGTVTGLAFRCNRNSNTNDDVSLAVASYGEVNLIDTSASLLPSYCSPSTVLRRTGAAIECIDVAFDGTQIAVGFLDKTLRVYTLKSSNNNETKTVHENYDAIDWVGFNAAVKAVQFSGPVSTLPSQVSSGTVTQHNRPASSSWLAAMGGNTILVIRAGLDERNEPPIICRTPGRTQSDGGDGTCHRFIKMEWSSISPPLSSTSNTTASLSCTLLLAALDAQDGSIHIFHFNCDANVNIKTKSSRKSTTNYNVTNTIEDAWPRRSLPIYTIQPSFMNPSKTISSTLFTFFPPPLSTDSYSITSALETGRNTPRHQENNLLECQILDIPTASNMNTNELGQTGQDIDESNDKLLTDRNTTSIDEWKKLKKDNNRDGTSDSNPSSLMRSKRSFIVLIGFALLLITYRTMAINRSKKLDTDKNNMYTSISQSTNIRTACKDPQYDEEEAKKYLYYSKAAFCTEHAITTWTCGPMCDRVPILGTDTIRYIPEGNSYGVQGYVARIPSTSATESSNPAAAVDETDNHTNKNKKCVVSFRGSLNLKNWYADFLFMLKPWPTSAMMQNSTTTNSKNNVVNKNEVDWCQGCKAHTGFASAYDELRWDVIRAVQELDCTSIVVSGHSLGGAIAALASFDLRAMMGYHVESTWTYGKPRLGNAAFANSFVAAATQQQVVPPIWRVVHYHDPVPRAPPSFGKLYPVVHPPLEIYYTDRASTQYLVCGSSAEQPHHDKGGDSGGTQENTSSLCMGGFPLYLSLNTDHISYLNESFAFKDFPAACKATNTTTTA